MKEVVEMNKVLYFKLKLKQENTCNEINSYCEQNNCEPISVATDKFGNIIVVVKYNEDVK